MTFHLLGLPNTPVAAAYSLDGFATATRSFAKLLHSLGHTVFLYGAEGSDAPCTEFVPVITEEERTTLLGDCPYQYAAMEEKFPLWALSNPRMVVEIGRRKHPQDFICTIGGLSQKAVADAHPDLMTVEYSIGYIASFAKFRVYESHIWRHCTHGFQDDQQGKFYDTVIPYFFDPAEFAYNATPELFCLYVGRLVTSKGIGIACEAAALAGMPLKVIGHGDPGLVTHGAEYLGALNGKERNEWMSRASVLFAPTQYLEPFGAVVVEANLCGTPVITTDFGAFVETVEQGRTGYRCNLLGEFVAAVGKAAQLDRNYIRKRAESLYSIKAVAPQYQAYFERLMTLWGQGWRS